MNISNKTLIKLTNNDSQSKYIGSRSFELRCIVRKAIKRTGLSIEEISIIVSQKKSKSHLKNLTSYGRFKKQGDIHNVTFDSMIKKLVAIPSK